MATVNIIASFDVFSANIGQWAQFTSLSVTSTQVTINYGSSGTAVFNGFGFDTANGLPSTGTVTSFSEYIGGVQIYDVGEIAVPTASFVGWVSTGDTWTALGTVLGGDDKIYGELFGSNSDTLLSFGGDDVVFAGGGDDYVSGMAGNDFLAGETGSDIIVGDAGNDYISGGADYDFILGGSGLDTIHGGEYYDVIYGNLDADLIYGNAGEDVAYGGLGRDTLMGGRGADLIYGGFDNDIVYGNFENDTLFGGQGDDTMVGGQGDDVLVGNLGNDVLAGSLGADLFVFGVNSGSDVVVAFSFEQGDRIALQGQTYSVRDTSDGMALDLSGGGTILLNDIEPPEFSSAYLV